MATYLISDEDGQFVRWSNSDEKNPGEFAQRICDYCAKMGVDWQDVGAAECHIKGAGEKMYCRACRDQLECALEYALEQGFITKIED